MSLEKFMDACEERLRRVEAVVGVPLELEAELIELEVLLRNDWATAMSKAQDEGLSTESRERIQLLFEKIKKIEIKTKARVSLFDGLEDFMRGSKNR